MKQVKWIWKITALILGTIITGYLMYGIFTNHDRRVTFLKKYLPDKASITLLVYCEKYKVDWLKALALLYAESEGKQTARSRNSNGSSDYGYFQLNGGGTLQHLRQRLKRHFDDVDKYSTEFNICGGILHLRSLLTYFDGDYYKAVEVYNIGVGNYRKGKTNNKHLDKWMTYFTYFKMEWIYSNKFLGVF